jgi:hypothetical protein
VGGGSAASLQQAADHLPVGTRVLAPDPTTVSTPGARHLLALTFKLQRVGILIASIYRGGLRLTVPVAPLVGARDAKKTKRYVAIAVDMLTQATTGHREIDLLVCSGWRFVGWSRDPGWLYGPLQKAGHNLKLRVLILDPSCEAAQARARYVMQGRDFRHYQAGTNAVLWTLRQLQVVHGADIKVRFYAEAPIWQMVILDNDLWLMTATKDVPTDSSPVWRVRRHRPYSLAHGLEAVFERRWASATDVNLSAVAEPDGDEVVQLPPAWE